MYPLKEPIEEISYFAPISCRQILRMLLTTAFTLAAMSALSPVLTLTVLPLIPVCMVTRQYFRRSLLARRTPRRMIGSPGVISSKSISHR